MNEEQWDYICLELEILEDESKRIMLKGFISSLLKKKEEKANKKLTRYKMKHPHIWNYDKDGGECIQCGIRSNFKKE